MYEHRKKHEILDGEEGRSRLQKLIREIREAGNGKQYDCIVGVSGGVDSTYTLYLAKKLGLRPLAVHVDNGWDAELAVHNIEKTLKKLEIDLCTLVLDWEEFKDLQVAFLRASVPDGEHPSDHAYQAGVFQKAVDLGVKYILKGANLATEGIMPIKWSYSTQDIRYIKAVYNRFSISKLRSYPHFSLYKFFNYRNIKKIKIPAILNMIDYNKQQAINILQSELDWVYYGGKHYESIYTRFWQGYVLPKKFNIDKRKAHFSTLICSNQMTRAEALEKIKSEPYPEDLMMEDREYVIKKLSLTENEFNDIMNLPKKTFMDYPNNYELKHKLKTIARLFTNSKHSP
jgi:N-acetyl sugar amidotransferase